MRSQEVSSDRPLTLFALAGFIAASGLLFQEHSPFSAGIEPEKDVGVVERTLGSVRRRHQGSLVWRSMRDGARLYEGDSIFTGQASSADVRLADGSVLEIDASSLIVLDRVARREAPEIRLEEGRVRGESAAMALRMRTGSSIAHLGANAVASVAVENGRTEIYSSSGTVSVSSASAVALALGPNSAMRIDASGTTVERWSVRLSSPENGAFVRHRGETPSPHVELRWSGHDEAAAGVKLSCGLDSVRRIAIVGTSGSLVVPAPSSGICRWRLVDETGRERSEERRFAVVEVRPPVPLRPVADEMVVAPAGDALLAWTRVNGAERYRVELSSDLAFSMTELVRDVERAEQLLVALPASEQRWHWRVRGIGEGLDEPWSATETFRITTIRGSEAPTRLDAEVRFDAVP